VKSTPELRESDYSPYERDWPYSYQAHLPKEHRLTWERAKKLGIKRPLEDWDWRRGDPPTI
jgi:hypothetical protein